MRREIVESRQAFQREAVFIVALVGLVAVIVTLVGCNGPLRYENQNGPRGPESFEVPAPEWPRFGKACCDKPKSVDEAVRDLERALKASGGGSASVSVPRKGDG